MREATIELIFRRQLRKLGCIVYKFVSPGNDGVPDRIVITPAGRVVWVELKTDTGRLAPIQIMQIKRLREHGQDVRVVHGLDAVKQFIEEIRKEGRQDNENR